jgi:hypothetical protein
MGVDYSGNFGIGFKVLIPELEEGHEYYDDVLGYLESLLENTEFNYFVGRKLHWRCKMIFLSV